LTVLVKNSRIFNKPKVLFI